MDRKTKVYQLGLDSVFERKLGLFDRNSLSAHYRGNPVSHEDLAQSRLKKSIIISGLALSVLVLSVVIEQFNIDFRQLGNFASSALEGEPLKNFKDLVAKFSFMER